MYWAPAGTWYTFAYVLALAGPAARPRPRAVASPATRATMNRVARFLSLIFLHFSHNLDVGTALEQKYVLRRHSQCGRDQVDNAFAGDLVCVLEDTDDDPIARTVTVPPDVLDLRQTAAALGYCSHVLHHLLLRYLWQPHIGNTQ